MALFFDDSEDENQSTAGPSRASKPSFFDHDDDEYVEPLGALKRKRVSAANSEKWEPRTPQKNIVQSSSQHSPILILDEDDDDKSSNYEPSPFKPTSPPPVKKRRMSSPDIDTSRLSLDPKPEPKGTPPPLPKSMFLGHMVIDDAWATCGGKNLIAAGDEVTIYRDGAEPSSRKSTSGTGLDSKKPSGKQMTLSAMMTKQKVQPPQFKKKTKEDVIVRFGTNKHQDIGRLPNKMAIWVSKLLDKQVIKLKGTVIDCPSPLRTGCHLILSIRFEFLPSAFSEFDPTDQSTPMSALEMMKEGSETDMEKYYSERKKSLMQLFDVLSLKPVKKGKKGGPDDAAIAFSKERVSKSDSSKGKAKEVIGEGEEQEEVEAEGEELTTNQLSVIYKRAQQNDTQMGEMYPADSFTLTLRPYQRQALFWMYSTENGSSAARDADSMHPLWEQYAFPCEPTGDVIDLSEDEDMFYYNPYSGQLSLVFPRAERNCRGGILADVGMGKSIMVSSLIHTNRGPDTVQSPDAESSGQRPKHTRNQETLQFISKPVKGKQRASKDTPEGPCATLIVAPLSLLAQWKSELDRSSQNGTLKTMIYHGTSRGEVDTLVDSEGGDRVDVVITSYGTLSSEHAKFLRGGSSSFFDIEWMRVVLDEAHFAKSRNTKTAKATYALKARRRWALTGTPIVNRLEDLFSLLHFLRDEPWSDFAFFKSCIITPFLGQDPKCLDVVQIILESILLRREKSMKDKDGNPIVMLPPKEVTTQELEFSPMERKIYDSIFSDAKTAYDRFNARGVVGKNMSNILAMLMRLRRAVLHPSLIQPKKKACNDSDDEIMEIDSLDPGETLDLNSMIAQFTGGYEAQSGVVKKEENVFARDVLKNMKDIDKQECPLCLDTLDDPVLIPECHHAGCKACIVEHIHDQEEKGNQGFCPVCQRKPVEERSLIEVVVRKKPSKPIDDDTGPSSSPPDITLRTNSFISSTKLDALTQNLRRLASEEPTFRAIIFSQFTGFLDLIEVVLRREGFTHYRLDGTLSQNKRTQVLREFSEDSDSPKIFAISLKAGGVGLNLTNANHVFMMDCWWNSAVESQAIDRVHRIGQEKTVYVTHFIISQTIEARIVAIQKRKTALIKGALGGSGKTEKEAFENLKIMFA